jgi:hypothetical protein
MSEPGFQTDIYTEQDVDPDTLANLGPLRGLAGVWAGTAGRDLHPAASGSEEDAFTERYELQPIDPQSNGPQLLYGLRYWIHVLRPGEPETFHDQVGYFLWEPDTGLVIQTLAIPRGQIAMAFGHAAADARTFELEARRGEVTNGICSNAFLDQAFRTMEYRIRVTVDSETQWRYDEDTVLLVKGTTEPFHHKDSNTLIRVAEPTPNPLLLRLQSA